MASDYGQLIVPPKWYPNYLPRFYRQANGAIRLLPEGAIKATAGDVLDVLLYQQTWCGYNRVDYQNAVSVAWFKTDGLDGAKQRVQDHFRGAAQGDYAWVPGYSIGVDGALYSQLQTRYIQNESGTMPWLAAMQGKGGGIDLMSIPAATDIEISRPNWYPNYLPSLFKSAGAPYQWPAGSMNTKPKIKNNKSSGYTQYAITAADVANLCVYAQPVIYAGPTPYPTNWYINDVVNGAIAMRFKISLNVDAGFTNAQAQAWGMVGDIMKAPVLDANPYASGFTQTLEKIVSFAITYFAGKIPGGSKAITAAYTAGNISGGQYITGTDAPPSGPFTIEVFNAAHRIQVQQEESKNDGVLLLGVAAAALVGFWMYNRGKK